MEWRVSPPKPDGTTRVINLDLGTTPEWWHSIPNIASARPIDNGAVIVLKIPGSTGWSGRGETSYHATYFQVLRVLRVDEYGNYICEPIIDFPVRNK